MPRIARLPRPFLATLVLGAAALVVATPVPTYAAETAAAPQERPARGMRMSEVEARYGAPTTRHEAVGTPPITRWDYPGLIVYFEHDHVVHAVLSAPAG